MDLQFAYLFMEYGLIAIFILGFALFFAIALVARDVDIIRKKPFVFAIETILISVIPAIPLFFFSVSRGIEFRKTLTWVIGLSIKFAVFHIIFQLSGFYTFMFS